MQGHASETAFYQLARRDAHLMGVLVPMCYYAQHFRRSGSQSGLLLFDDLCDTGAVKPLYNGLSPRALRAVSDLLLIVLISAFNLVAENKKLSSQMRKILWQIVQSSLFYTFILS